MLIFLCFLLFLTIVMFSIALALWAIRGHERKKVRGVLAQLEPQPEQIKTPARTEKPQVPALDRRMTTAVALFLGGAVLGFLLRNVLPEPAASLILGGIAAAIPTLRTRHQRTKRIRTFEAQFPDALEFLSRSMLAGHGFAISLSLLADEATDPLASVFRNVSSELQLGQPLDRALTRISDEIPLIDVRFFVSAVLLQQASGGNLAEILNKLAFVVRERFRLAGEVRAASAHGRLTSAVLVALPILLTVALLITDPDYLRQFAAEPEGRFLLIAAVCGQLAGHTIIQRIVNIKV